MVELKKIDVMDMSFFLGLFGFFIGIVVAILQIILWLSSSLVIGKNIDSLISFLGFWGSMGLLPVIYGIVLFLVGLIFIPILNLTLKILKGVELDMVESTSPKPSKDNKEKIQEEPKKEQPTIKPLPVQQTQIIQQV